MNKPELYFRLILCNAICDQCIYFLFIATYTKNRDEGKNGIDSNDEIKEKLFESLIDSEIEFKFG